MFNPLNLFKKSYLIVFECLDSNNETITGNTIIWGHKKIKINHLEKIEAFILKRIKEKSDIVPERVLITNVIKL